MSILQLDLELVRHYADAIGVRSDFARKVEQACDLLAIMESQQQAFDALLGETRKVIQESRALLREVDHDLGEVFGV